MLFTIIVNDYDDLFMFVLLCYFNPLFISLLNEIVRDKGSIVIRLRGKECMYVARVKSVGVYVM